MINWTRIEELQTEVGEDGFDEVVEMFLEEVEDVLARLELSQSTSALEQDFHFLKGSALNVGFTSFGTVCGTAEAIAAKGLKVGIDIRSISGCYALSKDAFLCELAGRKAGRSGPSAESNQKLGKNLILGDVPIGEARSIHLRP
jgi:histidine phosphotransfer protein HptB